MRQFLTFISAILRLFYVINYLLPILNPRFRTPHPVFRPTLQKTQKLQVDVLRSYDALQERQII